MKLTFVLVEPKVPENVGAAARALRTMGFTDLWLVGNDCRDHPRAAWLAHGSRDILEKARFFPSLAPVREAADLMIGTSAKPRHGRETWLPPADLAAALNQRRQDTGRVMLVFGREDRGLSNDELELCDLVSGIPLACSYPSLNLAQAVMLYAYELTDVDQAPLPAPVQAPAGWRQLRGRLEALLPRTGVKPGSKLHDWALERLGLLSARDAGFVNTLCQNLEVRLPEPEDEQSGQTGQKDLSP